MTGITLHIILQMFQFNLQDAVPFLMLLAGGLGAWISTITRVTRLEVKIENLEREFKSFIINTDKRIDEIRRDLKEEMQKNAQEIKGLKELLLELIAK